MMAPYLVRLFCLSLAVFSDPLRGGAGGGGERPCSDSRGAAYAAASGQSDFC